MKTPPTWEGPFFALLRGMSTERKNDVLSAIASLLTSHEATIRKEIGERIEEIRRTHYIHGAFIKHKNILDDLLSLINQTP